MRAIGSGGVAIGGSLSVEASMPATNEVAVASGDVGNQGVGQQVHGH
jgi:hypothetical protein